MLFFISTPTSQSIYAKPNLWENAETGIISKYFASCWQEMHTVMHTYINTKFMCLRNSTVTPTATFHKIRQGFKIARCCNMKSFVDSYGKKIILWTQIKLSPNEWRFQNKISYGRYIYVFRFPI